MDEKQVLEQLKKLHREIEEDAGKCPDFVTDDVQPLESLGGFDSVLIPNVIRGLARAMGITIAKGKRLRNPYAGPDRQNFTLRDIAKRFCKLYGTEGKAS